MGGGGGVFGGNYTPEKYKEIIRQSRESTQDAQFETTVNEKINERLGGYSRDSDTTREHLDEIKDIIVEDTIGTVEMRFGGSVSKHTYVDGLSDVDVLVIIDKSELSESSPQEVLKYIKKKLIDANSENIEDITVGKSAVTVKFSGGEEIQLLPAIRRGEGYRISAEKGDNWSNIIRPDKFAGKLTEVNQNCNGKVVPVVKLVKGIISQLPEDQQLTGYHIESIAIEVFKSYPDSNTKTPKAMLSYFFEKAKDVVKSPIEDKSNQSIHVDDSLGPRNSQERMRASYTLDRIARRMKNADEVGSVEEWESILGE
ncbi:MAG: CBASS oligonucleotide cyclase [Candidatus Methanoperedens sp.]|nr:CBASS oligonucleotide cyclase [Candidatus Methanoperedens sp.]CAG0982538.1 hypothetical protein METP1_01853 [Methanosarcinales archaeon]